MTRFNDIVPLRSAKRVKDNNGFVHVPAAITRVGIQEYTKDQLGVPGVNGSEIVRVFRPAETVFHVDTMESFRHLPVTDGHPPSGVSPRNAKVVQGGHIGEDVTQSDEKSLVATLHLTDESFIKRSKGAQTSAGYDATIVPEEGEFEGAKYQYRFDGAMIGNHLALVDKARCGEGCRVLDEHKKEKQMEVHEVQAMIDASNAKLEEKITGAVGQTVQDALTAHQTKADKAAEEKAKADKAAEEKAKADKAAEEKTKNDEAATARKIDLHTKIKPLLGDKYDAAKSNVELLALLFADSIDDAETKSEDYLLAMLDQEIERRKKGGGAAPVQDSTTAGGVTVKPII